MQQGLPELLVKWALKGLLNDAVSGVIRELYNIDLGIWEKPVRLQAEEHESHIFWPCVLRQGTDDVHTFTEIQKLHSVNLWV